MHLTAMSYPEHEDYQFIVLDLVDDSVVADANAEFTITALQLDTAGRPWVAGQRPDRIE